MKQMSLGAAGFERKTKRTREREFLDEAGVAAETQRLQGVIDENCR